MSVWRTLSQVARYVSGEAAEDDVPMMESLASFQRHFEEDGGADAAGKIERKVAAEDKTGKSAAEKWEVFSSLDLSKYVGKDVLSVASLPIWLFEPTTTLQRIGEIFEHGHRLLVLADNEPDPAMRMAYVAAFAVANYAGSERTLKPFNPILGETFECVGGGDDEGDGSSSNNRFYLLAEQVSHHPPIGAACAECPAHYQYAITSAPRTKFHGNSVSIFPANHTEIRLKKHPGEIYRIRSPTTTVNSLIVGGGMWTDTHGTLNLWTDGGGAECVLNFEECGLFGEGRYEVAGTVRLANDAAPALAVCGMWNEGLDAVACDADGNPINDADPVPLWRVVPADVDAAKVHKFNLSPFVERQNHASSVGALAPPDDQDSSAAYGAVLASDSRLRPDRLALERGDLASAARWKVALEERQRAERRRRDAEGGSYAPRFFRCRRGGGGGGDVKEDPRDAVPYDADRAVFRARVAAALAAPGTSPFDGSWVERAAFAPWQFADETDSSACAATA